uniref:Histone-lysine N-methyltransferase SETMAR n=1 Tax=Heterorhabditis bacteriophora TaxID=37862 RepID=A0A1I7XKG1_HETBA
MASVGCSASGVIHYNFLDPSGAITEEKYCYEIDKMHQELQRLRPVLVNRKGPILFYDNVPPHVSQMTPKKLDQLGCETLRHAVYSPDLSPTDYHFFKHLDNFLQEKDSRIMLPQ